MNIRLAETEYVMAENTFLIKFEGVVECLVVVTLISSDRSVVRL